MIKKIKSASKLTYIGIFALVVVLAGSAYLIINYTKLSSEIGLYKNDPEAQAIKEKNELLNKVGKLVKLPEDEEPTIATVADVNRLKNQLFFVRAENGDKVILFPKSGRAVLYRPSIEKVIESAPVNITDVQNSVSEPDQTQQEQQVEVLGDQTASEEETEYTKEPAQIAVYNGTLTVAGLAGDVSEYLVGKYEDQVEITDLKNAGDYFDETVIVSFSENYETLVSEIAQSLEATKTDFPQGEEKPSEDVDILIIIGNDFVQKDISLEADQQ